MPLLGYSKNQKVQAPGFAQFKVLFLLFSLNGKGKVISKEKSNKKDQQKSKKFGSKWLRRTE
jgi:hypothetical protein